MPLPPGKIEFVDRSGELQFVSGLRDQEDQATPRACVIQAQPDSGISRFLEEACRQSKEGAISLAISGSNSVAGSAFAQIALALFSSYHQHYQEFLRFSKKKFGSYPVLEYLPYIAAPLPYVGSITQAVLKQSLIESKKEFEQFPSILAGLISEFLADVAREERIALFIDDVQDLDSWSLELLEVTAASPYSRIRYFLGHASRSTSSQENGHSGLIDDLSAFGYDITDYQFPSPEAGFIQALASHAGLDIGPQVVRDIEERSQGRMRRVISEIRHLETIGREPNQREASSTLTPLESEIVSFIWAAKQSLRLSDLKSVCTESPELFFVDVNEVDSAIRMLEEQEIVERNDIPGGDELVGLHSFSHDAVQQLAHDEVRQLRAREQIYQFINRQVETGSARHSETELIPLAYRLSKTQDPQKTRTFARRIIQLSLSTGSYENARRFIDEVILSEELTDYSDTVVFAGILMSLRRYREALEFIEKKKPDGSRERLHLRILRAICLNRVRRHGESEREIDNLLAGDLHVETRLILSAYKISGRVHENDMSSAQALFRTFSEKYRGHPYYTYFARNAAATLPTEDAIDHLEEVLQNLDWESDPFGFASVQNNLAAQYLEMNEPDRALPHLRSAADRLALFGVHHLHIVENNFGFALCKLGQIDEAVQRLKRARICSRSTFPNLYIHLNLALCYMCLKSEAESLADLDTARQQLLAGDSFSRLHQKYYINAALILSGLGTRRAEWQGLLEQAKVNPDRKNPEITTRAVQVVCSLSTDATLSAQNVLSYFSPCTLEYWYFNPMDLVAEEMLSTCAKGENML